MSELDNSLKAVAKGTGIGILGIALSKVFGYIYRIIIARIGAEQYGLVSMGIAVYALLTTIAILGMGYGVLRFVSYYRRNNESDKIKGVIFSSLNFVIPTGFILAILLFILSEEIALKFFHDPRLSVIFKLFAIAIPFSTIRDIFLNVSKAYHKVQYEVYSKHILENLSRIILTFLFILIGFGVMGVSLAYLISIFLSLALAFYLTEKKVFSVFNRSIKPIYSNKELILFSFPLLFSGAINSLIGWTSTIILGFFRSSSDVGVYNAALPTAQLLYIIPLSLTAISVPVLTALYAKENKEDFRDLYRITTKWIFLINLIPLSLFYLLGSVILQGFFGKEYISSINVLIILGISFFFGSLATNPNNILVVLKKTKLIFLNMSIGFFLNIILNAYLIPLKGLVGAAIAIGMSVIVMGILSLAQAFYYTKIIPFSTTYLKIAFSFL